MTLIAVEGPSFAGKSTLLAQLAAHFSTEVIKEHYDYAQAGSPSDRPKNEDPYANADFFIGLEKRRALDIKAAFGQHDLVFSDRSVVSLLAYELGITAVKDKIPVMVVVPEYLMKVARQEIGARKIVVPDGFILLRTADEETHNLRVKERGKTNSDIFNQYFFSQAISNTTEQACKLLCPDTPALTIISMNVEGGRKQTFEEAVKFVEGITIESKA
jgi:thymidylate kinase